MSTIPSTLACYFQEYRVDDLDLVRHAELIIGRTLEFGTRTELRWLFATYGAERVREFVRTRGVRKLSKRAFTFWTTVLGVADYVTPAWLGERPAVWGF